jgi:membrane protein implicated in regulation of membrane protease activity
MENFVPYLGHWLWWIAAGVLLILELLAPGIFLIWLGVAAGLTGLADMIFDLSWQAELLIFAVLSAASVAAGRSVYRGRNVDPDDNPFLNRRQHGYVGQSFTLDEPIANGRGKLTIEDTIWKIEGPDMKAGSRVKVAGISGMRLIVVPAA